MLDRLDPPERAKMTAAYRALALVEDGMRLGLGTGSTANWLVRFLGARRHLEGLDVTCVATSRATEALARGCGLQTGPLEAVGWLDLTIDGADEVDGGLRLIKGGGGALLREKIVATASERMVVIADDGKYVTRLGGFPLPVEVVRFGRSATETLIADVLDGAEVGRRAISLREEGGRPMITDEGHNILDLSLGWIGAPAQLARRLLAVPGVVETGLFLGVADTAILGFASGEVRVLSAGHDPEDIDPPEDTRLQAFLAHVLARRD